MPISSVFFTLFTFLFLLAQAVKSQNHLKWSCSKNEVYLKAQRLCYPLAKLNDLCFDNKQCITPNSYCGLSQTFDYSLCMCKNGYIEDTGGSSCLKMYSCEFNGFNPTFQQGDCPSERQFCEYGRCLCKPNYSYNDDLVCIKDIEPDNEEEEEPGDHLNATKDTATETPNKSESILVPVLILLVAVIVFSAAGYLFGVIQRQMDDNDDNGVILNGDEALLGRKPPSLLANEV